MSDTVRARPVVLAILDGWGLAAPGAGNAVDLAATPNFDHWSATCPFTTLAASGLDVGLPPGQIGNSEVGHLNIGAGFVVYQELTRISKAIDDGDFFTNEALHKAIAHAQQTGGNLHLMGLFGPGGVHAHEDHLHAILELARREAFERVFLHLFLDGRDVLPRSALGFLDSLEAAIEQTGVGHVATVIGRYYAMDRDKRWERTGRAYAALVAGHGETAPNPRAAIQQAYARGENDEFVVPTVIVREHVPVATIQDGDAVIFTNFRPDRGRQLTRALVLPDLNDQIQRHYQKQVEEGQPLPSNIWQRERQVANLHVVTLTQYEGGLPMEMAFPPRPVRDPIAAVVSAAGRHQFHIAETEKYPHVTFFLNGGREDPFPGEDRILVPSPKVATYDLQPEMSAAGVTEELLKAIQSDQYDFIVANYANPDMVGHTGDIQAVIRACEAVDSGMGQVVPAVLERGGAVLIIADHGNAEQMIDPESGGVHTAHTTNPVPCILVAAPELELGAVKLREGGRLADIAPTLLALMGLKPAGDMTGENLIVGAEV
ncbi:2,3-bisphosphoglycerate-independent phosphoglycerate mutase [Candidatus Viridilinea mediisalina]|uniref:2,3-bisphosphoglycerate-independent phosphoglycerate mutase n=1 Tax=Candidatus Viridilinea mediisalina TaxID=2024553 RepID=A0A2A6RG76_9CHLR|nr:2,3-bisphosphoglycerate-independent phosphoglycerate mutase [Candidatus Viridilinea mediisalina]PDW01878.1 phosphoglycerate mutase (2,3-diphosphoglycerate-independent) [Candidatus Viridilinea mediisalina]